MYTTTVWYCIVGHGNVAPFAGWYCKVWYDLLPHLRCLHLIWHDVRHDGMYDVLDPGWHPPSWPDRYALHQRGASILRLHTKLISMMNTHHDMSSFACHDVIPICHSTFLFNIFLCVFSNFVMHLLAARLPSSLVQISALHGLAFTLSTSLYR